MKIPSPTEFIAIFCGCLIGSLVFLCFTKMERVDFICSAVSTVIAFVGMSIFAAFVGPKVKNQN